MRKHLVKDATLRIKFSKNEKKRLIWKMLVNNTYLSVQTRNLAAYVLFLDKNYFVKIKNFCIFTGRARGGVNTFKMSRMCFKKHVNKGLFEGVKKASW